MTGMRWMAMMRLGKEEAERENSGGAVEGEG